MLLIVGFINFISFRFYGFGITRKLIVIISQTNYNEFNEFLPGFINNISSLFCKWRSYLMISIIILFCILIKIFKSNLFFVTVISISIIGFTCFCFTSFKYTYGRTAIFMFLRIPKYTYEVFKTDKELKSLLEKRKSFPHPETVSSSKSAKNIIIIIGESASKNHHGFFGYKNNTTPYLSSMKDSLFIFQNAIGSSASTAGNIERILTFKEDDQTFNDWYKYPSIIDLFSIAGYKTFFISNQERTGLLSNSSAAIAESADIIYYVGAENSEDFLSFKYDEAVLEPFIKGFSQDDIYKFFIIHLMGSHTTYKNRYPTEFNRFNKNDIKLLTNRNSWIDDNKAQTIAEYDNSILYTDYVLKKIFDVVKHSDNPSVLLYFSDHGENVYDDRDFIGRDEKYIEVPFIIYLNSSYKKTNPNIVERVKQSVDLPFSTANVIYFIMTLSDTKYPLYYNSKKDVLSTDFNMSQRYVDEHIWQYEKIK